jgi:hypothetical protein
MEQVTSHVLMIRPAAFGFNAETAVNNTFQMKPTDQDTKHIADIAIAEFDSFVNTLRTEGVDVTVIEDSADPLKPDAVFPNNWISFHENGTLVTYPMYSKLRRLERREDIVDEIATKFNVVRRDHFEESEKENQFLEGTGSMVLDRVNKIAYACISERTDRELLHQWCEKMGYTPHTFYAESNGKPIYHTNVMMAIGSEVAVVCLDCIPDLSERAALKKSLSERHEVIEISQAQVNSFAGNMLALKNKDGEEIMVMSSSAHNSLNPEQIREIEKYTRIVAAPINTIENVGGGSARCMIAEIFLQPN